MVRRWIRLFFCRSSRRRTSLEKLANHRSKRIHLHEKRIVAANTVEFLKTCVLANLGETGGQLTLLVNGKQNIRTHANDQRALELQSPESRLQGTAVFGKVEKVRGM